MRRTLLILLVLSILPTLLLVGLPATGEQPGASVPSIDQLIRQLDDDDFQTREKATLTLIEHPEAALLVEKAASAGSPEVRVRAGRILTEWKVRERKARIERLRARAKSGEVDQLIEQLVLRPGDLDDDLWRTILELVFTVDKAAKKASTMKVSILDTNFNFMAQPVILPGGDVRNMISNCRLLSAEPIRAVTIDDGLIISQGSILSRTRMVSNAILLANDDIRITGVAKYSIIICDGNVNVDIALHCVIIATGTVKIGDNLEYPNIVIQNELRPLGLLRFFDSKDLGVEVRQDKSGIAIKKVTPGGLFAARGLQEGDRCISFNDRPIQTTADFRKQLRHYAIHSQETHVVFQRAERKLDVTLPLKESDLPRKDPLPLDKYPSKGWSQRDP